MIKRKNRKNRKMSSKSSKDMKKQIGDLLYQFSKIEKLYICKGPFLCKYAKSWKHNRPVDYIKVQQIVKTIEDNNREQIEGIIYLALIDGKLFCYDGNHRLEAFKLLNGKIKVLVNVKVYKKDEDIKKIFVELNKASPVSELYMEDPTEMNEIRRKLIEGIVKNTRKAFPKFISQSSKPNRPNFSNTTLTDMLQEKYKDEDVSKLTIEKVFGNMLQLNSDYAKGKHININKYSEKMSSKCKKHGCYLFLKNFTEDL